MRVFPSFGTNHPQTELAIQNVVTNEYLQGNGAMDIDRVWKTKAEWEIDSITNADTESVVDTGNITQRYQVYARNFGKIRNDNPSPGTSGTIPPSFAITGREVVDTDDDGVGDSIKLTFSQNVDDKTVKRQDFIITDPDASGAEIKGGHIIKPKGALKDDSFVTIFIGNQFNSDKELRVQYDGIKLESVGGQDLPTEVSGNNAADKVGPAITGVEAVFIAETTKTVVIVTLSESLISASEAENPGNWEILKLPESSPLPLATLQYDPASKTVKFTLSTDLSGTNSVLVVGSNIRDIKGNLRVRTEKTNTSIFKKRHKVNERAPFGKAVKISSVIRIKFDRNMNWKTLEGSGVRIRVVQDNQGNSVSKPVAGTVKILEGSLEVIYEPSSPLQKGCLYQVIIASDVEDSFGLSLNREMTWEFTTAADHMAKTVVTPVDGMKLTIQPGAFSEDAGVNVTTDPVNNAEHTDKTLITRAIKIARAKGAYAGDPSHYPISTLMFEITGETANGAVIQGTLGNKIILSLSYPDQDNDGIVDGTNPPVEARNLEIFLLDEVLGEFKKVSGSSVNLEEKTVSGTIDHLSIYAVMTAISASVSNFLIRPNPWEPHKNSSPVLLDNLPDPAEIRIYTVTAQRVITLHGNGSSILEWNGRNERGESVAPGVYTVMLKGPGGIKRKKLTIIR